MWFVARRYRGYGEGCRWRRALSVSKKLVVPCAAGRGNEDHANNDHRYPFLWGRVCGLADGVEMGEDRGVIGHLGFRGGSAIKIVQDFIDQAHRQRPHTWAAKPVAAALNKAAV